jgi:hypothetical protein
MMFDKFHVFSEQFHDGELIVQDKYALYKCNPEVDSMFLTANTYYFLQRKFHFSPFYTKVGDEFFARRFYQAGARANAPYNQPSNLSRDNHIGFINYLGWTGETELAKSAAKQILLRGSFFQNTHTTLGERKLLPDFCGPSSWACIVRACSLHSLVAFPLLFILDALALLQTCFTVFFTPADKASTVYHTLATLHRGTVKQPTVFSKLSWKCFVNWRKKVPGYEAESGVISALMYYSRASYDPPIFEIAKQFLKENL